MENTNETVENTLNSLMKINQFVNENVQKSWRLQAHQKYLKTECENLDKEIKDLKTKIEAENQTCKNFKESLERALKIKDLEMNTIDLATEMHPQLVQQEFDERTKLNKWTSKFASIYEEHLKKFEEFKHNTEAKNPLLKELRNLKAKIKMLEFDKKFCNEKIKDAEKAFKLKKEIYQKMFYAIVVNFAQAITKYHHRNTVLNELKENEVLMENLHNQYKRKCIETENKRISDDISNKMEINRLNLQLPGNLMENAYQSILPEIPLRSSYQNYEMPDVDMSSILTKYKKRSEKRNEVTKKLDLLTAKQSNHVMAIKSNEIKPSAKRSLEDAQSTKPVKKSYNPQKNVSAGPEICNKIKPQGIMKNIENENINERIASSQKSITKQVVFNMKDGSSPERAWANDKSFTSKTSQENLTQSQSDKTRLTPNINSSKIAAASTNFNFILGNQKSQLQKNTKRLVNTQNKTDLKFPSLGFGSGFQISGDRNTEANKEPEQTHVATQSIENPGKGKSFLKTPNSIAVEKQSLEFSPYFQRQELQPNETNRNEEQENAKNVTTDLTECDGEAEQYISYEFLTPQEDELSAAENLTFLGEDQHMDAGEEQSAFMFNLGQPSNSFKPFSFFN